MSLHRPLETIACATALAVALISNSAYSQGNNPAAPGSVETIPVADGARQIPAKNTLIVPDPSEPIRVQLVKFDGTDAAEFAGLGLTVVSPDTSDRRYKINNQGAVVFKVEKSGLYALIISGPMGHAAMPVAIRIAESSDGEAANERVAYVTPTINLPVFSLAAGEALRAARSYLPPSKSTLADIDSDLVTSGDLAITTDFRVNLSDAGRLEGQLISLLQDDLAKRSLDGNNLLLYRKGKLHARAISDPLGRFAFENLEAGTYGIICVGSIGYAAFAFEAVMPTMLANTENREILVALAAQQPPAGNALPVVPIPGSLVPNLPSLLQDPDQPSEDPFPPQPDAALSSVPGGGGAGFGGAGGGGGGLGGGGGMLGLAALGVAAALAASDSNNDRVILNPAPDPATPANVLP
jgi:hypothetical protein